MTPNRVNLTSIDRAGCAAGSIALLTWAVRHRGLVGSGALGVAAWLLYQAWTGSSPVLQSLGIRVNPRPREADAGETVVVEDRIAIARSREELYRFCRELSTLRRVAPHLLDVRALDRDRSLWSVQRPRGAVTDWESEITADEPGRRIDWRATRDGLLVHFGSVQFEDLAQDHGTAVRVRVEYVPAAGAIGSAVSEVLGQSPQRLVRDSLRRSKQLLETGEIATTSGQPAGHSRSPVAARLEQPPAATV